MCKDKDGEFVGWVTSYPRVWHCGCFRMVENLAPMRFIVEPVWGRMIFNGA